MNLQEGLDHNEKLKKQLQSEQQKKRIKELQQQNKLYNEIWSGAVGILVISLLNFTYCLSTDDWEKMYVGPVFPLILGVISILQLLKDKKYKMPLIYSFVVVGISILMIIAAFNV